MPTALDLDLWLASAFPGGRSPPLSRQSGFIFADRKPSLRSERAGSLVGNTRVRSCAVRRFPPGSH
jgi:hypothetical protein